MWCASAWREKENTPVLQKCSKTFSQVGVEGCSVLEIIHTRYFFYRGHLRNRSNSYHHPSSAKLLGITMDNDQKWASHFTGKNGLIPALTRRLFTIRRLVNHLPRQKLRNVVDSLWTSKLRYGLQLCTRVRVSEEEKERTTI